MSHPPKWRPALQTAWTRMLLFMWLNFPAALHGHSCILLLPWQQGRAATQEKPVSAYVGCPQWEGSNTEWPLLMPYRKCVHSMSRKTKAPDQPMRFCFLCGLYWCLLSTYILIYFEKLGGHALKSLDIFGVEKLCVYQIIVTLSCSLKISWIFGRII